MVDKFSVTRNRLKPVSSSLGISDWSTRGPFQADRLSSRKTSWKIRSFQIQKTNVEFSEFLLESANLHLQLKT